jgi:hypothetical protein
MIYPEYVLLAMLVINATMPIYEPLAIAFAGSINQMVGNDV